MTGPITAHLDTVDDLRGQHLHNGRYRLLDLLGLGGPSEVWLALDTHLERQVAIKTLRADAGGAWAEITAHEAKTLAQIDHPHVVPVYDSFVERGRPWIVMKFIRGRTLADVLEEDGPLPEDKLWDVARAISGALAASHQAGIVHRDLKPANVIIGHDKTIWLVDFGIALSSRAIATASPGTPVGTLAYMAPESLAGRGLDLSADLWSLGVLLLTLATGSNPFQRPDRTTTTGAILHAPIPDLPFPSLRPVGQRLLNRDPERRPTAAALAELLRAGIPDRIAEASGRGFLRRRTSRANASRRTSAPSVEAARLVEAAAAVEPAPASPATRMDSRLAYWGMSRVIDNPVAVAPPVSPPAGSAAPVRAPQAVPVRAPQAPVPAGSPGSARTRSPGNTVRDAADAALPVLGGWGLQALAALAGLWIGVVCVAPLSVPNLPTLAMVAAGVTAVVATCLTAGSLRASTGRWLTITVGWAVMLAMAMTVALQVSPVLAAAVPLAALGVAAWLQRVYRDPRCPGGSAEGTSSTTNTVATVTVLGAVVAVASGAAVANGILVLAGGPAAGPAVLIAAWTVSVLGVSTVLGRGATRLQDLLSVCVGIVAASTQTLVLAVGIELWQDAFGSDPAGWSAATRWWAYGLAVGVLAVGMGAQVRVGRALRRAATDGASVSALGALLLGCLVSCVVGVAVGVAATFWTDQLVVPALLFVVPAAAGGYAAVRAACTPAGAGLLASRDRNWSLFGWLAGWSALLAAALTVLPLGVAPLLPHLDQAGLAVAVAVCTVVLGVCGQLPATMTFTWARGQTGATLGGNAIRLALQLVGAAAGIAVGMVVTDVAQGPPATPPAILAAVLAAGLSVVVVDLARMDTAWSCALVLVGTAGALVGATYAERHLQDQFGPGSWTFVQHAAYLGILFCVVAAVVLLVRFVAELSRNVRGERENHAFSALVLAALIGAAGYGLLVWMA